MNLFLVHVQAVLFLAMFRMSCWMKLMIFEILAVYLIRNQHIVLSLLICATDEFLDHSIRDIMRMFIPVLRTFTECVADK
jgi:hypothetical protein